MGLFAASVRFMAAALSPHAPVDQGAEDSGGVPAREKEGLISP